MLELRATRPRFPQLYGQGAKDFLLLVWQTRHILSNMSRLRGKRAEGRDESGRIAPVDESREDVGLDLVKGNNYKNNVGNKFNSIRQLPYEERIRAYLEARNRIFDERLLDGMRMVTRKMKKARDRFKRRRQVKRQVVAAVARSARTDPRVFAEFKLEGRQLRGLLDSGATVSLLGRGCRELAEELNLPVKPYTSIVRTASGEDRSIIGRMVVPVEYKGEVKEVVMYLCPYLEQTAYLGIDFWRIFRIAPEVVGHEEPVVEAIDDRRE